MLFIESRVVTMGVDEYHVHKLIVCSQDTSMLFIGGRVVIWVWTSITCIN